MLDDCNATGQQEFRCEPWSFSGIRSNWTVNNTESFRFYNYNLTDLDHCIIDYIMDKANISERFGRMQLPVNAILEELSL